MGYEPGVLLTGILGALACLSSALFLWQWRAAVRFPLRRPGRGGPGLRPVSVLKPLKGCEGQTESCLRSWFLQRYDGPWEVIFGVASEGDPACRVVERVAGEFPKVDARLVVCDESGGANPKVAKLVGLARQARHGLLVVSDADVSAPPDLLRELVLELEPAEVGLVSCLYRLPVPRTLAMWWEAVAVNADFWSQVVQAKSLGSLDFALGAVMAMRREALERVHGFEALVDCLADDFQLGYRIARAGYEVGLAKVLVECRPDPMGWRAVWKHQLRWARTIRVCRPAAYFCSILSNATLWPLVLVVVSSNPIAWAIAAVCWGVRLAGALDLQRRLCQQWPPAHRVWVPWLKDLLQVAVWAGAFCGNTVEWRGGRLQVRSDGTLVKAAAPLQSP